MAPPTVLGWQDEGADIWERRDQDEQSVGEKKAVIMLVKGFY
jgi:hypothetical protein